MSEAIDRLAGKVDEMNNNVLQLIGRLDHIEAVKKDLARDVWGDGSDAGPGLKTSVDRLVQSEKARIWWLRIIAGTTFSVLVERIVQWFKYGKGIMQ